MTDRGVTEPVVEDAALAWLESLGWQNAHNLDIALGGLRVTGAEKFIGRAV